MMRATAVVSLKISRSLYKSPFLADAAKRDRYNLRDVGHVSWVGSVQYRSWLTHDCRLGYDDLDRDLPDARANY